MNEKISGFIKGFVPTFFVLGLVACLVIHYVNYKLQQNTIAEFVEVALGGDEALKEACFTVHAPRGTTTFDQVIYVDQLCDCVVLEVHNMLKEKQIFNQIKENRDKWGGEFGDFIRETLIMLNYTICYGNIR